MVSTLVWKIIGIKMKAYEILSESKKVEPPKPRNFVAKNAKSSGAGAHTDKKKAAKQGVMKHKAKELPEGRLSYDKKTAQMKHDNSDPDQRHGLYIDNKLVKTYASKEQAENIKRREERFKDAVIKKIAEDATPGATSSANIGTVINPHHSPGKARGKTSYIGSPGKSGTKAPPQPKVKQPKNADGTAKNGVDMPNLFGNTAIKRT